MTTNEQRISILGCGSLGTAILIGLSRATSQPAARIKPSKIVATVTSKASQAKLSDNLKQSNIQLPYEVLAGSNVEAVLATDVVILACPPGVMGSVLSEEGMRDASKGKILISVLAGVTRVEMETALYGDATTQENSEGRCWVFRALPNLAAASNASATAVERSEPYAPQEMLDLVDAVVGTWGGITHVPAKTMDAATVLCGSTPAFFALFVDALVDGAVAAGVPRYQAQSMAAQALGSTAALLNEGEGKSPSMLREEVCAMPGCTILGSLVLDQGGVRAAAARAAKESIEAAAGLGKK